MSLKYGEKAALLFQGTSLSYSELNRKADRIARLLQDHGIQKQDIVAVYFDRSPELIAALVGILKAGAVYLPLDASYPLERKAFMLADAKPKVLLTSPAYASRFPHPKILTLDHLPDQAPTPVSVNGSDLAYICYTSGSTGTPKGVEVHHQGVLRLAANPTWVPVAPEDRFLFISNISFDAATFDIWGALLNGLTLSIFPQTEITSERLGEILERDQVTHLFCTPKLFNSLIESDPLIFRPLRILSVGGDVLSAHHAKLFLKAVPSCRLFNDYGPTENTCISTAYEVKGHENDIPIGRPIDHTTVFLLDDNLQPVQEGELYTGGLGVARGYLNRPEETASKFIDNPFGPGKLYRTGDLARWLPCGNLAFLGRADRQVKIRGFRIEPGEIENALRQHPSVSDCLVQAREGLLTAYLEGSAEGLREFAQSKLPEHMVPHFFVPLERFPLTPNGKVDHKALPCPKQFLKATEPPTEKEQRIAEVWKRVLKLPQINRNDHFFHLGGDSINSVQLACEVGKALGRKVPIHWIFENATLKNYVKRLDEETSASAICWEKETQLDPSILPPSSFLPQKTKKIFLTGATGFVGAFFLRELLEKSDATIYCHLRGEGRLQPILEAYSIWKPAYAARIVEVPGNLGQPFLGIETNLFSTLASEIDAIYHIGALVNHALPYESLRAPNVFGTQEALRLAAAKKLKPFHFISTVDVLNPQTPYAYSKWAAERLVEKAQERGIPANIYRLSRVVGDTQTGSGPTGDFLWRMIQVCQRVNLFPALDYQEEMTPVDFVCQAILHLSSNLNNTYPVFDSRFTSYSSVFKLLANQLVDAETWRSHLLTSATNSNDPALQALSTLFSEKGLSSSEKPLPNEPLLKALEGSGIEFPAINEALLQKYLAYYAKIGFLKSPAA